MIECSNNGCSNIPLKNKRSVCKICSHVQSYITRYKNKIKKTGSLQDHFPEIASQFHPEKNGGLRACDILPYSNKKHWWICPEKHNDYEMNVNNRTSKGQICPKCRDYATSRLELRLFVEFKAQGLNVKLREKICDKEADLFFEDLNLIIEVDGYRWHSTPEKKKIDIDKQKAWEQAGYTVVRVRESKLDKLGRYNIFYLKSHAYKFFPFIQNIIVNLNKIIPKASEFRLIAKHYKETQTFLDDASYQKLKLQSYSRSDRLVTREGYPLLFDELDLEKHTFKELEMSSIGSADKKFHWICKICGYKWKASIYHRATRGQGCVKCHRENRASKQRIKHGIKFYEDHPRLKRNLVGDYEEAIQKNNTQKVAYHCDNHPNCLNIYFRNRVYWLRKNRTSHLLCKDCR